MLLCRSTFEAVKHLAYELGCVDADGMNYNQLHSQRGTWTALWR